MFFAVASSLTCFQSEFCWKYLFPLTFSTSRPSHSSEFQQEFLKGAYKQEMPAYKVNSLDATIHFSLFRQAIHLLSCDIHRLVTTKESTTF